MVYRWRPPRYRIDHLSSTFWHQNVRQRIGHPATFVTQSVLGLRRHTLSARYAHLFLTFLNSGLYHVPVDYIQGVPLARTGAVHFFVLQAAAIAVEDAVQWAWSRRQPAGEEAPKHKPSRFYRLLGVMWVVAWLAWSTPIWSYPMFQIQEQRDSTLIGAVQSFIGRYALD